MLRTVPLLAAASLLTLAGCASTPASTVTTTPAAAPTTAASSTPASTATSTTTATSTATSTVTATQTAPAPSAPATSSSAPASKPPSSSTHFVRDDPAKFKGPDGSLQFKTPSGLIGCAGGGTGNTKNYLIGCQIRHEVKGVADCPGDGARQPSAYIMLSGEKKQGCTTQGTFAFGDRPVLEYGHAIVGEGFACTSEEAGVKCWSSSKPAAFKISSEGIEISSPEGPQLPG